MICTWHSDCHSLIHPGEREKLRIHFRPGCSLRWGRSWWKAAATAMNCLSMFQEEEEKKRKEWRGRKNALQLHSYTCTKAPIAPVAANCKEKKRETGATSGRWDPKREAQLTVCVPFLPNLSLLSKSVIGSAWFLHFQSRRGINLPLELWARERRKVSEKWSRGTIDTLRGKRKRDNRMCLYVSPC